VEKDGKDQLDRSDIGSMKFVCVYNVRNEEVLHRVKEERSMLHTVCYIQ
jgi:hypothetical protein